MKKTLNLKLTQLSKQELSEKELNRLLGGEDTNCCICNNTSSGSGIEINAVLNYEGGESGLVHEGGGWGNGSFGGDPVSPIKPDW